ncbi:murein hydrolase activator EnvC family protein [Microterricola viridarii]|uniref:Peptidase family M23 n=1 Tax=Microterricola viridarii TaxID=412690 RepID=A0A1H1T7S3_9MICO|nr:M23 family metallopeptidase [Microterricola viridarii]SDS56257.1 Peptidase family M23 [Microterricola viridarii]
MPTSTRRVLLIPLLAALALGAGATPPAPPPAAPAHAPSGPVNPTAREPARWDWPLGIPHIVVRGFQAPATRYAAGHRGIDLEAAVGTAVFAPAAGSVSFAGVVVDRPVLAIRHDGELVSSYEALESDLVAGDTVAAGQRIGVVATGGHCDGGCLHFGVRQRGAYVSPMLLLGGLQRAVLLPLG